MSLKNLLFDRTRLDREWTSRQAVLWALAVSGGAPLGVLIGDALGDGLSWTRAATLLVTWAVLLALFLLSVWGKVSPQRRRR